MHRRTILILLAVAAAFLLLAIPSANYRISGVDTAAADSAQYHFIAMNLLQGKGYRSRPIGNFASYGEDSRQFLERPIQTRLEARFNVAAQRGPGYPLFLAAIYLIHGPHPSIVVKYQALLAGLTGVLMVLIARRLWGEWAAVLGVVAALLLRHEPETAYGVAALMSECLAAFLLTLAMFTALWAKRGTATREILVAVVMSAAVLTRQALLLTAVFYGVFLLLPRFSWKRVLAFALPCAIAFSAWSAFLSAQNGGTVLMASTGSSNALNGLDPVACAVANGVHPPEIEEHALESYWGGPPIGDTPALRQTVLRRLPRRFGEVLRLLRIKLKIGFLWLPYTLMWCAVIGAALGSTLAICDVEDEWQFTPDRARRSRLYAALFCWASALTLVFFILGYSNPAVVTACLLLLPLAALAPAAVSRSSDVPSERGVSRLWLSSWLLGYLGMTVATIGVKRFIRPYLPVLFLFAAAAIPLFVSYASGLLNATYSIGRHTVRFRWRERST